MEPANKIVEQLSPWWKRAVLITLLIGFSVLILVAVLAYRDAPPIPDAIITSSGEVLLTGGDILAGQEVFLKYGLMENGTIWGHGAYLGPDFSAAYLHTLGVDTAEAQAQKLFGRSMDHLSRGERGTVEEEVRLMLKQNRYDPGTGTLLFTEPEAASYRKQISRWTGYFSMPAGNGGLKRNYISDRTELEQLTAFFAWAAWASVADRPGESRTYTNNFPYDPPWWATPLPAMPFFGAPLALSLSSLARRLCCLLSANSITLVGRVQARMSIRICCRVAQATAKERP